MKHLKIVFTLTIVVVGMMVGVFAIEQALRPEIIAEAAARANLAKDEVLPGAADYPVAVEDSLLSGDYDTTGTGITAIYYYADLGYVYQAEFTGYQSTITYMLGFDEDGMVTGYKTLSQNDTPGYGGNISLPEYWIQLFDLSINDLQTGNFDGISGATFTTTGWKDSFNKVISFHNNVFLNMETIDITATMNDLPTYISKVEEITQNGNTLYYTYTAEFTGYIDIPSTYTISINAGDSSIRNISFIEVNETDGIGSHIQDPEFVEQFNNLSLEDASNANFDMVGGATFPFTYAGFKTAFTELYIYHRQEIDGYVTPVETDEERLIRYYQELSSEDAVLVDTTLNYNLGTSGITQVEEDDDYVIFHAVFAGYHDDIEIMIGIDKTTSKVTGLRFLSADETYGGDLTQEFDYMDTFTDMSSIIAMYGEFDALSGATLTTFKLRDGLYNVIQFYREEYLGEVFGGEPSLYDQVLDHASTFYPTAETVTDVTKDYVASHLIMGIYEVKDASDTLLGFIFAGDSEGASYSETTYIHYLVAIAPDKTFQGLLLIDDTDTEGRADTYYLDSYSAQFVDLDIESSTYNVDETAGATATNEAILAGAREVAIYYVEDILGLEFARPQPYTTSETNLLGAFPTAVTFESVYLDYEYSEDILNVYAAKDGTDQIIGYVYYAKSSGQFNAYITWGVNLSNLTQNVYVPYEYTSWEDSSAYLGTETFPDNQTFLPLFENIQIDSILDTQVNIVDSWSGVSTTTGNLRDLFEAIAQYHLDNIGGGN